MAECVNSSPRLTSLKFLESWGDLGELGGIQGNSGKLRGIQGISFPNFVERSILKLPLSNLRAVPFALQKRALFEGEKKAKRHQEKGRKRGGQQRGQKGKKDA